VVGEIGHLPMVAGRRLQLAAERSGVTALILRRWRNAAEAAAERDRPSAALTRWRVAALPSADIADEPGIAHGSSPWAEGPRPRWRVELRRARGGVPGIWDVEVADATGHVSLSAELADRPAAPAWLRAAPGRPPAEAGDPGAGHRRAG
jgi:protein ImuA